MREIADHGVDQAVGALAYVADALVKIGQQGLAALVIKAPAAGVVNIMPNYRSGSMFGGEVEVRGPVAEFSVDHFDAKSDPKACQPGAGETFKAGPDGVLDYTATYSGAHGQLRRSE